MISKKRKMSSAAAGDDIDLANGSALPVLNPVMPIVVGIHFCRRERPYDSKELEFAALVIRVLLKASKESKKLAVGRRKSTSVLLDFTQAVINDLNFSVYKALYPALTDLFDIHIDGALPILCNTEPQRCDFLTKFTKSLYDKLSRDDGNIYDDDILQYNFEP